MTDQHKPDDADTDATAPDEAAAESTADKRRRRRAEAYAPQPPESEARRTGESDPGRRKPFMERRREKIRAEIERNRRGEYTVPTWVLVVALIAILVGWAAIIVFV